MIGLIPAENLGVAHVPLCKVAIGAKEGKDHTNLSPAIEVVGKSIAQKKTGMPLGDSITSSLVGSAPPVTWDGPKVKAGAFDNPTSSLGLPKDCYFSSQSCISGCMTILHVLLMSSLLPKFMLEALPQ